MIKTLWLCCQSSKWTRHQWTPLPHCRPNGWAWTRLHISSTPSFKRSLHLSLNLPPSRLQTRFYTGQKSTRASHHLYGLGAISINNGKFSDGRRTDSGPGRCGRGRLNRLLASTSYFRDASDMPLSWCLFFFFFYFSFQFQIWLHVQNPCCRIQRSCQLDQDQIWPSVALERIFEEDKDGGFVNRRLFVLWADVWPEKTAADQFGQCCCFRFIGIVC